MFIGAILPNNAIDTSTKHDYKHWNPIISIMSINQHITSLVLVYLQCTYLFSHCSFLGCPPSQDIKCHQYFKYQSKSPNTRTIPTLRVSPMCYSGCLSLFFSLDVPSSQHTKCQLKPPNTRTIPCTPLSSISFLCSSGWCTKLRHSILAHIHSS